MELEERIASPQSFQKEKEEFLRSFVSQIWVSPNNQMRKTGVRRVEEAIKVLILDGRGRNTTCTQPRIAINYSHRYPSQNKANKEKEEDEGFH